MGKFCTNCGAALTAGARFCPGCETPVASAAAEEKGLTDKKKDLAGEMIQRGTARAGAAASYIGGVTASAVPAPTAAGEAALPLQLAPVLFEQERLREVLGGGLGELVGGFKRTLADRKRLAVVIALVAVWLAVNLLAVKGIFPLPVRLLSWLTAARGTLIGGTAAKGLIAAFIAQVVADKGFFTEFKNGCGQLTTVFRSGKQDASLLLAGAGAALLICNFMVTTSWVHTMVPLAGFVLSARALAGDGFLRRLAGALLPRADHSRTAALMGGWTLGFALFAAMSALPGSRGGYWLGLPLLIVGAVLTVVWKEEKGVAA